MEKNHKLFLSSPLIPTSEGHPVRKKWSSEKGMDNLKAKGLFIFS
jgi:hypothetical protein